MNVEKQKELPEFEVFYTIQGKDFFFTGSQEVKSDYDEEKLAREFRQFLARAFPLESIQITAIKPLTKD